MKTVIRRVTILILLITMFSISAFASCIPHNEQFSSIEYLQNGDYIITEYAVESSTSLAKGVLASTKNGTKTASYYTASGSIVWSVIVDGTFSYTYGVSVTATASSATVRIYNAGASYVTKSAYTSGNVATASGTVKYSGINTTKSVSVSCDKYGNLS